MAAYSIRRLYESGQQQAKAKVFISYSRKDMAFANRLEAALRQRGFEPLIDRTDIYAFEDWSFGFGEPKKAADAQTRLDRVQSPSPKR